MVEAVGAVVPLAGPGVDRVAGAEVGVRDGGAVCGGEDGGGEAEDAAEEEEDVEVEGAGSGLGRC